MDRMGELLSLPGVKVLPNMNTLDHLPAAPEYTSWERWDRGDDIGRRVAVQVNPPIDSLAALTDAQSVGLMASRCQLNSRWLASLSLPVRAMDSHLLLFPK